MNRKTPGEVFEAIMDALCLLMMLVGTSMIVGKLWAVYYNVKGVEFVTYWSVEYNDGSKAGPLVGLEEKLKK